MRSEVMVERKVQSGYIIGMDKSYIFTYDGDLLQLVPKDEESIKPYDCFKNMNMNYDVLEGNTIGFDKVFFLNCHLKVYLSGYIAKPAGYVCFSNNERKFDVITFKSGIIDYFYRPNHIIDKENTQYDYNTGEAALKLKTFDKTSKEIEVEVAGEKAKLMLSVTLPVEPVYMQIDYNLGKPKSIFQLVFNEPVDIKDFREVYMWIYNLMVFLNFRKDISLGQIEFGKINEENSIGKIGYLYLNEKRKNNITNIDRIIGYNFVFDHINELLKIVNKEDLNLLFIPRSEREDKIISAEKYMICCTSFESVFNFTFPNAKAESCEKASEVKNEFLQYIAWKREKYKGQDAKKRKEFQKYADIIELLDFGLAEKFDYCILKYEKCIDEYKKKILRNFNFELEEFNDLSLQFAKKRNLLIHSSVEEFEDIHIFAYMIARALIYIMILDKSQLDSSIIIQAIDKVL